ncbi:MAG: helix-turn-helix domain-containing protein [Lachnospiraceae bacterium]|nr:helix-turn-helix domain-containing protein [Lachnospiraceae bacterium]
MNPTYRIFFGQRLKKLRLQQGLQQKTVATSLHVSPSTYSNYENGVYLPGIEALMLLADLFGVTLDELTGRDDYQKNP